MNDEYERKFRKMKTKFEDALDATAHQIKDLELERNEYYAKYNDLVDSLEEMKLKMKADFQKQFQDRFHQFVSDWNRRKALPGNAICST